MVIENFWLRLRNCPDTESEQALIRLVLVAAICGYAFSVGSFNEWPKYILLWLAISNSVFIISWIALNPSKSVIRRLYSISTDLICTSTLLYIGEQSAMFLFAIYIWIIIGYGFRYGIAYLYMSLSFSIFLFSLVIINSEYWGGIALPFSLGIIFSLMIIPIYTTKLIGNLRSAIQHADTANKAKSQFLATMSHEMRTPLTGIVGFIDLMRKETLSQKLEGYLDYIEHSAVNLRNIVNNVLDMSKIEAGELTLQERSVAFKQELQDAIASLRPLAHKNNLDLIIDIKQELPDFVMTDPTRLNEIVFNLVGNAIKFTSSGKVNFTAEKTGSEGSVDNVRLIIEDTGVGISQKKLNLVFEPFTQIEIGFNRRFEGTGLGLSIAKSIIDKMNGKISIDSELGKYTRVTVDLPFTTIKAGAEIGRTTSEKILDFKVNKLNALVVDDNGVNRSFMRELLTSHGFCTDVAVSGEDALLLCQRNVYDVIFMDIHMADMDGIETTRRLLNMNLKQKPVVIAVTADVFGQQDGNFPLNCFHAVLAKPVEGEALFDAVQKMFPARVEVNSARGQASPTSLNAPVLNSERGITLASGNKELWLKSVVKVLDVYMDEITKLRDANASGEYETIQKTAHKIKGSAAYVGAEALANCAQDLELFMLKDMRADCGVLIDGLEQEYIRLKSLFFSRRLKRH